MNTQMSLNSTVQKFLMQVSNWVCYAKLVSDWILQKCGIISLITNNVWPLLLSHQLLNHDSHSFCLKLLPVLLPPHPYIPTVNSWFCVWSLYRWLTIHRSWVLLCLKLCYHVFSQLDKCPHHIYFICVQTKKWAVAQILHKKSVW